MRPEPGRFGVREQEGRTMEPANPYKGEGATVAEGYDGIPDGSLNAVYLTMEEEAFADFRQAFKARNPKARSLLAEAAVSRKKYDDGIVQLYYRWHELLWKEGNPVIDDFMEALEGISEPYQLVRLGEELGEVVDIYAKGFENTDLDGFRIAQSTDWG